MTPRVRVLRRAALDLLEIRRFVALDNPEVAERLSRSIIKRLEGLETFPNSGAIPRDLRLRRRGYRFLVEGDYLIFYKLRSSQVRIHRIVHGRRRYAHLL